MGRRKINPGTVRGARRPARFFLLCCVLSFLMPGAAKAQEKAYDYLIKDAVIFDGKSPRGIRGDVAISEETIAEVGRIEGKTVREVISAKGLVLTPGFIDAHTHSDFNPLIYPDLPNKILQGVTTEITGNCGMSAAPVLGAYEKEINGVWAREGVPIPKVEWKTFREYRNFLQSSGMRTNHAALAGHGNLRGAVMGFAAREASPGEIEDMKKILAQAMAEGAAGISFGLVYVPGIYAGRAELVRLCREAGRRGGVCAFHMRSESSKLLEALSEAIEIGRAAQAAIQISHLKAAGSNNWDKIGQAFQRIEEARLQGMRITADAYPYAASQAELGVVLPDALYAREDRLDYFKNPFKREELLGTLRSYYEKKGMKWDTVMIAAAGRPEFRSYQGRTIKDIARKENKEPEKLLVDLLAGTSFETSAFYFSQSQDVVAQVMAKNYVAVGSDSIADESGWPHPRAYGSFPKIFREYVRGRKSLLLGEAVRKMTSLPADHFGLEGRGRIQSGFAADLVLFDPGEMADTGDYEHPKSFPVGVRCVFVNGKPAVREGKVTQEKNGRFLSRE